MEWIEWDLAIVDIKSSNVFSKWLEPDDVYILFECKVSGIYGDRETLCRVLGKLRDNFSLARNKCNNLKKCIYVSLMEVKGIRKGIDYQLITRDFLGDDSVVIFFDSRSIDRLISRHMDPIEISYKARLKNTWSDIVSLIVSK